MNQELFALTIATAFLHTIIGPDHYVPFIAMAKSEKWSLAKTTLTVLYCGLGHTGSSIMFGAVGIAFGLSVTQIGAFESLRGSSAVWMLIAFELLYFVWGLRRASEKHLNQGRPPFLTPLILIAIFILGPCEPLIPILISI